MTVTNQTGTKTTSRTISDVSQDAEPVQVANFVKALNGLSTDILVSIELVTKTDITNAKKNPHLTLTPNTVEVQQLVEGGSITVNIDYLGNGTLSISGVRPALQGSAVLNGKTLVITGDPVWPMAPTGDATATLTVSLSETEEYSAATAVFTYTNFAEEDRDVTFDDI